MQLMTNRKYILKTIISYNKNKCSVRMRGTYLNEPCFTSGRSAKHKQFKKIFRDYTGLSDKDVISLFNKYENISKMSCYHIADSLRICKIFNVDMSSLKNNIGFFSLGREDLKNRLLVLKEMGANYINTAMIQTMASSVPVILFKSYTRIPDDTCVADNMYSTLHEHPSRIPPLGELNESMSVYAYRHKCMEHYIRWKFKIDEMESLKTLNLKLIRKPLSYIEACFDVLHNHGKMPSKTILAHQCLINCSANDLRMIFQKIPTICGVPTVELFGNSPELHEMKYENVACIKTHFEMRNVTSEQLKRFPGVLLTQRDDFLEVWAVVIQRPDLQILSRHPNFVRIFTFPKHFSTRLEYLQYLNVKNVTPNLLTTQTENFERTLRHGVFLKLLSETCSTLNNDLGISVVRMQELLRIHPRSRYLNLYNTYTTMKYLQTKFSNSDIVQRLHIILYPKNKVKKVLEELIRHNELMDATDRYTIPQLLALCVYEIEKKYHFTGDGVWDNGRRRMVPRLFGKHSVR